MSGEKNLNKMHFKSVKALLASAKGGNFKLLNSLWIKDGISDKQVVQTNLK